MSASHVELLRERGLRATPQRLAVLEALTDGLGHPSAEEVHERLRDKHPTISLSTVYSSLASFADAGIVDALTLRDGLVRYDVNTHPHANFVCLECRQILDLETPAVDHLLEDLRASTPHEVVGQKVEVFGYCAACKAQTPAQTQS